MGFASLSVLLNTTAGMSQVRSTTNSTITDTLVGVSWFKFKGVICNNVYIDRNNYVGFGANANHLGICYKTSSQVMAIYRQEGTIGVNEIKFLKFRVEGSTRSGYTTSIYTVTYEIFMLETNEIFVNVIKTPTSSSYIGVSTYDSISLDVPINSTRQISMYSDSRGIKYELFYIPPFAIRYLVKSGETFYKDVDGVLTNLGSLSISSNAFITHGAMRKPTTSTLKTLSSPTILYWQDSTSVALPSLKATVSAIPPTQYLYQNVDFSDATIKSIAGVTTAYAGSPMVAFSKDNGTTWQSYNGSSWVAGEMFVYNAPVVLNQQAFEAWLGAQKNFRVRIALSELDELTHFTIHYNN